MHFIDRTPKIDKYFEENKVLVIFGPRQVGKTSLVKKFIADTKQDFLLLRGDEVRIQNLFSVPDSENLLNFIGNFKNIFIDEAQMIPNIGKVLKLLVDLGLGFKIIITGSSSFDLHGQVGEPLVGRMNIINLFPLSYTELKKENIYNSLNILENMMLYGGYPEVIKESLREKKIIKLENLTDSYLLKDIFAIEKLKKPTVILNLLKLLAHQIGSEVNINELAIKLEIRNETVERYIDILEKSFILFRLSPYSNNHRNEIKKKEKIYFYDLGIRNSLINNFEYIQTRGDVGGLFENFMMVERYKKMSYEHIYASKYFWREANGGEVDYLEIKDEKISAFEFTYFNNQGRKKLAKLFVDRYKPEIVEIIDKSNFYKFL